MQLSFSTHINNQPSYFTYKILLALWKEATINCGELLHSHVLKKIYEYDSIVKGSDQEISKQKLEDLKPKIHTIREDKSNRWKVGNKIHFIINPRTKKRFQFAPIVDVVSIQYIKIEWLGEGFYPYITIWDDEHETKLNPTNHFDYVSQLEDLSINDGFESFQEFLNYFDKDFEGKIIHWTNEKY